MEQFDFHYQVIQEMFASTADFGLIVLVMLCNHLQKFFEIVLNMEDVTKASSRQRDFLWRYAKGFLEGVENRRPPSAPQLRPREEAMALVRLKRRRIARQPKRGRRS